MSSLLLIDVEDHKNLRADNDIMVGTEAKEYMKLKSMNKSRVLVHVKSFYVAAVKYMTKKFPFNNKTIVHAAVADVSCRLDVSFSSMEYFINTYHCLQNPKLSCTEHLDALSQEFLVYQTGAFKNNILKLESDDERWHAISDLKDPSSEKPSF